MMTAPVRTRMALALVLGLGMVLGTACAGADGELQLARKKVRDPFTGQILWIEEGTPTPEPAEKKEKAPSDAKKEEVKERSAPEMGLSVREISKRVDEAQASMKDVTMALRMDMKDSLSGTKQKVRGVVKMKNPGRVYAHYTHPIEQFLYVKKDKVQMYQPDQGMVYVQEPQPGRRGEPVYLGVGHELKQYMAVSRVSVVKENEEEVTLLFVPKDQDALFERMKVVINKRTWWPFKIEMESPSVETKAEFRDFRFNQGLKDSLFDFNPPKDAQIVEGAVF